MHSNITVSPTDDNNYILAKELIYKDTLVPKGYKTNGANIPRILWPLVPPFKPKYLPAVIVHDYLCDIEDYIKADQYFKEILKEIEDTYITRTMVTAVKLYHRIRYNVK